MYRELIRELFIRASTGFDTTPRVYRTNVVRHEINEAHRFNIHYKAC